MLKWLNYLITNFFDKWNTKLNGEIKWQGEDISDNGIIVVVDSIIKVYDKKKSTNRFIKNMHR